MTFKWDNPERTVEAFSQALRERETALRRIPERAVRRATFELLKRVQDLVPKRTRTLVRSITALVERIGGDVVEGRVGSHMEYARYIEEGTGIYGPKGKAITIVPRNREALAWKGPGGIIVRKRAVIQGIKPRTPFGTAVAQFLPRFIEIIEQEVQKEAA